MKLKQKENAFKMHNIFNKEDTKVEIHMKRSLKNNSKAKRFKQQSITNHGVGKIKYLRKNPRGDLNLIDNFTTKIIEERDYGESTRNVLYCNNNKCQRVIKTSDGNFIFYLYIKFYLYL